MTNLPVFRRWRRLDKVLTTLRMPRRFAWENFTSRQCHCPILSLMLIIRSLSTVTNNCRQAFVVFFYTSSMNSAVKLWQNHEHLRYFRNACCLMMNLSKYQDMLVCQKTTNLFIILACSLVLLMPDCLFFLTTHVPEIFLVFVWVCGLSVKRSKQGFICLICQETLILQKRACIYTCR